MAEDKTLDIIAKMVSETKKEVIELRKELGFNINQIDKKDLQIRQLSIALAESKVELLNEKNRVASISKGMISEKLSALKKNREFDNLVKDVSELKTKINDK